MDTIIKLRQQQDIAIIKKMQQQATKAAADRCIEAWLGLKNKTL